MGTQTDRVRFNVRGKIFETPAKTFAGLSRSSTLGAMVDYEGNPQQTEVNKEYFIGRDPGCFSALLDLLETGELHIPPNVSKKLLYRDAKYYGLLDHVRTAQICKFNCNWLKLAHSVRDKALGNCTTIKASPNAGCAVVHGNTVHVYNWMLQQHSPLNLNYKIVSGLEWIDSENILVGCKDIRREDGGMGVFSSSTGELRHEFHLYDGKDEVNTFAQALCFDSDGKIFASCRGTSSSGIGVWDQVTGKQIDFFDMPLSHAKKIQWVNASNCLFVSTFQGRTSSINSINILDFRDKSKVWSWSMRVDDAWDSSMNVVDAIPMEKAYSVCLVNRHEDLGSVDLRSTGKSIRWIKSGRHRLSNVKNYYPKLTLHGGHLFSSVDDEISVYYDGLDQWALTSKIGKSGTIRDFSIDGDRLFALHSGENVFDVWETPSTPII